MDVRVSLLSGRTAVVRVAETELVEALQERAQAALGGRGRLMSSDGSALDPGSSVKRARLRDGDSGTLQLRLPRVRGGLRHYAVLEGDAKVVRIDTGATVQRVAALQCTAEAWAALLEDGSVVTWGDPAYGGDKNWAEPELRDVIEIQATDRAFAALMRDGSVSAWGHEDYGGGTPLEYGGDEFVSGVSCIQSNSSAFAAVMRDGTVCAWGDRDCGGWFFDNGLTGVVKIQANRWAFCAIMHDGSAEAWGHFDCGGLVDDDDRRPLTAVRDVQASVRAFAAILSDGSV